jgi:thiamine biosynthesis lipoprotein
MQRRTLLCASFGLVSAAAWAALPDSLPSHRRSGRALGTSVQLTVLHADAGLAQAAMADALAQVQAVDRLMSLLRDDSQVVRLNRDGVLVAPDARLLEVLAQARQLSQLSGGAFDVTVQPLWRLYADAQARGRLPSPQAVATTRALVDWRGLELSPQRVLLHRPGMAITLNGLAQGYAVDVALQTLRAHGIQQALLDTGEFGCLGAKAGGEPWRLGVKDPREPDRLAARLRMDGRALSTSGDYESLFSADFVHHHIFDPATGDSPPELAAVSVLAPSGLLADGLSTAFMVMGSQPALALARRLPAVDLLLIAKDGRHWHSPGLAALLA